MTNCSDAALTKTSDIYPSELERRKCLTICDCENSSYKGIQKLDGHFTQKELN